MNKTKYIWQNGIYKKWDEATVHVLAHTLHYGTGAFEGIRVYKTKDGPALFRLEDHIDRLIYSAKVIGMKVMYSREELCKIVVELIQKNEMTECYVRPLFYFGYKELGISAVNNPVELVIACWRWSEYLPHDQINVKTSRYIRINPDSTIPDAKLTGHYINNQLALLEIQGTKYDEVLMLDVNGFVTEGSGENLFIVKNDIIYTPKSGNILPGITRNTIIEMLKYFGYAVVEADLMLADVYNSDEAFLTGTAAEIISMNYLDDKIIGNNEVGPVTRFVKDQYHQLIHGNFQDFRHYLTFVCEQPENYCQDILYSDISSLQEI